MAPSLVTWPTRKSGKVCDFASRNNCAEQSRTWVTLPAPDWIASE